MSFLNDLYDAADQAMNIKEQKQREKSAKKAMAKEKAKQAAKKQDSGFF